VVHIAYAVDELVDICLESGRGEKRQEEKGESLIEDVCCLSRRWPVHEDPCLHLPNQNI
jgi:hypothetical protein